MKQNTLFRVLTLTAVLGIAASVPAQVPLDVTGITDKAYNSYSGSASFRVPSATGYSYRVLLDGQPVPTDVTVVVTNMDYHEVSVWRTNLQSSAVTNRLVRFLITTPGRGNTEHGIPPHTPLPAIPSAAPEFAEAHLRVIAPQSFPAGYEIPVVAWVVNSEEHAVRVNGTIASPGHPSITIKRGVGSSFLAATNPAGPLDYTPQIQGLQTNKTINLVTSTTWSTNSGVLGASTVWPADSRIYVPTNLTIPTGASLSIGAGTIVLLNGWVNITNNGAVTINGTVDNPVIFMPTARANPWGGFYMRSNASSVTGTGVIFTGSGRNPSGGAGHRSEQCLFLCSNSPSISLTDSAAIYMAGQLGHAYNGGTFTFTRFLMQRAVTGGEYTGAKFTAIDSAFIECPDDSANFVDGDNDAIYLVSGTNFFTNTLIGWTKDDGIDSGGSGYAPLRYQSCWFEATFHEGNSLSGYKDTRAWDTVYIDCGQGIEDGYNAPTGRVDRCLFVGNKIGVRHGDNYDNIGNYDGRMTATNSVFLQNHHDVWGYNWHTGTGNGWTNAVGQMFVGSNFFTTPIPDFPANEVWAPTSDFWRLTNWMTTPHGAAVGVGLAIRTNQFSLVTLFDGVLVRLSSFTTNAVTVNYSFLDTNDATLATGSLTFASGETLKRIYAAGFDVSAQNFVRVQLTGAINGELTGQTTADFMGSVPGVQVSGWIGTNLLQAGRLPEGMLVQLSTPAGLPVTVDYTFTASPGTLAGGTLTFAPGETVKWVNPAGVGAYDYDWTRLTLSNPGNAALAGISSVLYTNPPLMVNFGVATNEFSIGSFGSGLPVVLNSPAPAAGAAVDFTCEGGGSVLTNGTVVFTQGQTLQQLTAPTVNPASYDAIRVRLSNPVTASLGTPATVFYLRTVTPFIPTNNTFIASNSMWSYFDKTNDLGTAWRSNSFSDVTWSNGCAQLGFGDGDECTRVFSNEVNTCYYFRRTFNVDNVLNYTNLSLWLLRDDAGVVYINGGEVFRNANLPAAPTLITNRTLATSTGENSADTVTIPRTNLVSGDNLIAVEIHQQSRTSSDVTFMLQLVGNAVPPPVLPPAPVIASPINGTSYMLGAGIPVTVSATNSFTNVVLYADTLKVGEDGSAPFTFSVSGLAAGSHDLVALASDAAGVTLASAPVTIQVIAPPVITTQPTNQVALTNANVTFVAAATGTAPLTYQWWFNQTNLVSGATNATLNLINIHATNQGAYNLIVANAGGFATSDVAILTIPNADTDGDGMTDAWELAHGLDPRNPADAGLDPDHDGQTNLQESIAGTDPADKDSYLKVDAVAPSGSGNGFTVQFSAVADRSYSVLFADILPTNFWAKLQDVSPAPTNRLVTVTNEAVPSVHRFYRLVTPAQ